MRCWIHRFAKFKIISASRLPFFKWSLRLWRKALSRWDHGISGFQSSDSGGAKISVNRGITGYFYPFALEGCFATNVYGNSVSKDWQSLHWSWFWGTSNCGNWVAMPDSSTLLLNKIVRNASPRTMTFGSRSYYSLQNLSWSKALYHNFQCEMYRALIWSSVVAQCIGNLAYETKRREDTPNVFGEEL